MAIPQQMKAVPPPGMISSDEVRASLESWRRWAEDEGIWDWERQRTWDLLVTAGVVGMVVDGN